MAATDYANVCKVPHAGMHPAIPLLLQHASECICSDQATVCTLLQSSKELQEAVGSYCRGRLAVTWSLPKQQWKESRDRGSICFVELLRDETAPLAKYFAGWLGKHAVLARSLTLPQEWQLFSSSWQHAAAAELAAGLQAAAAAAAPSGIVLQAFTAHSIDALIISELPPQHLTSLTLSHKGELHGVAAVNAALLRLTNLRSLSLSHASQPHDASSDGFLHNLFGAPAWTLRRLSWEAQDDACLSCDGLLPGLAAMRQLTRLNLEGVYGAACLAQLPAAQLLHLELFVGGGGDDTGYGSNPFDGQQLPLGHLTAVTLLDCRCNSIHLETVLPPQLRVLRAHSCRSARPMLPLQQLRQLRIRDARIPADELLQLRNLTNLQNMAV